MIIKYERACKNAGLSEDQTKEIRRFFDAEKKRLKRLNEARLKYNISLFFISGSINGVTITADYEIPDPSVNIEDEILHQLDLERLRDVVKELSTEDQEFLKVYFELGEFPDTRASEMLGIPRQTVQYRKERILKELRGKFFAQIE